MAQRFGGKYSPDGSVQQDHGPAPAPGGPPNLFDGKRPAKAGARSNLLFLVPLVFGVQAFRQEPAGMTLGLAALGLMLGAAWLTREGIRAQEAYDLRRVAKRPAFPRKIAGSLLMGIGLFAGGLMSTGNPLTSALFGLLGLGLHLASFGPDPLTDKGAEGIDTFQTERVARAVDEGEAYLAAMKDAILRARDRALDARVERFAVAARQLFRSVEADPRDLTAARKYLGVYLMGARDATVKFADYYAQSRDAKARAEYESLLSDLETTFAGRTQALLVQDSGDLDVEIQVLRERLHYETPKA
ncbi:5-bromo-4-chloroindolyl phosphate hydrolysis protein [Gemmobacter aquatilis]|uniref:5-bromo-4-chloroindolyl phosphate hydrolysis protein n=1 Tax=Gemmobacter aquatilis TaxID=933059 RepID=A0A1H8E3L6_9RHOB|nr:5-bromo-4-chloroindolyl phosphate hydrolysis family protein [Gemmobacter aquatilis]SEN14082.1 5-bromo-4-chloroindolyl phosphate hydrolysis protein [Gemmobacter aquatilis]